MRPHGRGVNVAEGEGKGTTHSDERGPEPTRGGGAVGDRSRPNRLGGVDAGAGGDLPLLGRAAELAEIGRALAHGAGVAMVGAIGVGKTRLLRAALARAADDGAEVLLVRATASAATIPLAAVVDLLPDAGGLHDPLRVFQASAELLAARAAGRPVVIGIDDAHQLDVGSAALVLHLVGKGARVALTLREGVEAPDAVTVLWKDDAIRRLELATLGEAATGELTEALLQGPVEELALRWVYVTSVGNPLYLRELVAGAVQSGALERDDVLWRLRGRRPPGRALSELVSVRLNGIGEAGTVALAALGLGEPLEAAIVERVVPGGELETLERDGLVMVERGDAGPSVRLAHPLYGEIARHRLSTAALDGVRVRLAELVRGSGEAPGVAMRVATWLRDAGAPIDRPLLLEAARDAYRARDPALAADFARRADHGGRDPAVGLTLGQALAALGRPAEAERVLAGIERGQATERGDTIVYLFTRINVLVWGLGDGDGAEQLVRRAASWWDDPGWQRHVTALELMVLSATGKVAQAVAVADALRDTGSGDPFVADLLATSGAVAWLHAGRTTTAVAATERVLPPPPGDERLADRGIAGLVSWALTRLESGREWVQVRERVERIERAAVRDGDRIAAGPALGLLGYLALQRGAPVTALRLLRETAGHLREHDPRGLSVLIECHCSQAAALLGDAERARRSLQAARAHLRERPAAWHERPRLALAYAWAVAADGEPSRAVAELLERARELGPWPLLQALVCQDALSLGAPAAQVAALLETARERCDDAPRVAAAARHATALAARDPAQLIAVAGELERIGLVLACAEAASHAALHYRESGRESAARRATALASRALAACEGASTPALRAAQAETAALTRREREIAALAADGLANGEIAQRLVVSVRTVESHLYHAMTKLGVRQRSELAASFAHERVPLDR